MTEHVNDDTPPGDDTGREAFAAELAELHERVDSVHERQICPACGTNIGERCVGVRTGREVKHPHQERLRADGIYLR